MPRHLRVIDGQALPQADSPQADSPITLVLAERHEPMRRTLLDVIQSEPDLVLLGDVHELAPAEQTVRRECASVLVVDLGLLDGDLMDAVAQLCERMRGASIVILASEIIPALAGGVVHAGAKGFVLKEHADAELPEAVRAAARGETFISSRMGIGRMNRAGFPAAEHGTLRIHPQRARM